MSKIDFEKLLGQDTKNFDNAVRSLTAIQKGKFPPISTGLDFMDTMMLGGFMRQTITTIAARSGNGKSWLSANLKTNILDSGRDVAVLDFDLEMPEFTNLILALKKELNKPLKEILNNLPTSPEEIEVYKRVAERFRDPRIHRITTTMVPDDFLDVTREFLERNKDKEMAFVFLDHILVLLGENKNTTLLRAMEGISALKLEYPNSCFVVMSQLNREFEVNIRNTTNPLSQFPSSSSFYASDSMLFYSDLCLALVLPSRFNIETYGAINREHNKHLMDHICEDDVDSTKNYLRLKAYNRIYYHFIKIRLFEEGVPTIYCKVLSEDKEREELEFMNKEESTKDVEELKF